MFLPLDVPNVGKKILHRRSKTICAKIDQKQINQNKTEIKRSLPHDNKSKSKPVFKEILPVKSNPLENTQLSPMNKMTKQIQKLIYRQLPYPHIITSPKAHKQKNLRLDNPQSCNEFTQTFINQKLQRNYTIGFTEPQFLILLKKSQRLNSKSFVPHFNWKEKLNRARNMGNYGQIYKKKTQKNIQPKPNIIPQEQKEYIVDFSKTITDTPAIIIREPPSMSSLRKGLAHRRCRTSNIEETFQKAKQSENRYNQTYLMGEKHYYKKQSFSKGSYNENCTVANKREQSREREWKFGPWDE